ncbi:uncharacterized protein LOC133188928 [Saccostrea echinata]|uniref:uncharacterized protein LOC133188928 n=1 Tax=Saccostrea echinata TaxID=191078 RepID=UPI002A80523B|nr:uncharacterized protein LOC133188928 [Saccostrea echinata]
MCIMNILVKTFLFSTFLIYSSSEPLGYMVMADSGNGLENMPKVEQIDIDKELQKELNTLESRLQFIETTLIHFKKDYDVLNESYNNMKTQFDQATARINQLENSTQKTRMEVVEQNLKYSDLQSVNSNLQKTVNDTNIRLKTNTAALSTEISNITDEVINMSDMTSRDFASLRNKDLILENKFQEISKNQLSIASTLNQIKFQKRKPVVFVAKLSRDVILSDREIITFDDVKLNEGLGFDPIRGVFTSTTNGIYTFSVLVESTNRAVRAAIYRNNEPFAQISGQLLNRGGALASSTTYVHLDEGDRVWIQWTGDNAMIGHLQSQFTGHLLNI